MAARLVLKKVDTRNDSALLEYAAALGRNGLFTPRIEHEFPSADIVHTHTVVAESGSGKVVSTRS